MCTQLFSRQITSELAVIRAQSARLRRFPFTPYGGLLVQCFTNNAQPAIDCASTLESISAPLQSRRATRTRQNPRFPKLEPPTSFALVRRRVQVRWHASDARIRRAIDAVQNIRARPLSTLGESARQREREVGAEQACVGPHLARPGGRKPPLVAEVGQSIFHERIIGIVRFMEAKELRGAAGLQVWHGTCML